MNRLRSIAIEERRQLITFGFAVLVFMMTLLALQLRDRGSAFNRVDGANRANASHAMRHYDTASQRNRAVALAAMTSNR